MTRRPGFTLIELVVVIMILGILAGVAAPKFFNTSATAKDNSLRQTLSVVRDAIELYYAQKGALPGCTSGGADFKILMAPYLRTAIPAVAVGPTTIQNSDIAVGTGATTTPDGSPTMGYKYNTDNGTFIINTTATSATPGVTYDKF
jgi:prepilin-type N-terminal cleavage/methylation domain-containing protein